MRPWSLIALLSAAAFAASTPEELGAQISVQCANPLFKAHWYTNDAEFSHLQGVPATYTRLVRCKAWNDRPSCCNPSMEAPQQVAFDTWLHQFELQVTLLKFYHRSLQTLSQGDVYKHSGELERALFDRALAAFPPALATARRCVRALMVFVAGMICFSCDPGWEDFVWRSADGAITAVNVSADSCVYVDQRCGPFGRAVKLAAERVMESTLAKTPSAALPDLSMFEDRITDCEWLRASVATQPLRGGAPASRRLEQVDSFDPFAASGEGQAVDMAVVLASTTAPTTTTSTAPAPTTTTLPVAVVRATAAPPAVPLPTAPPGATVPRRVLDPVQDGLRTGFQFPPQV